MKRHHGVEHWAMVHDGSGIGVVMGRKVCLMVASDGNKAQLGGGGVLGSSKANNPEDVHPDGGGERGCWRGTQPTNSFGLGGKGKTNHHIPCQVYGKNRGPIHGSISGAKHAILKKTRYLKPKASMDNRKWGGGGVDI